MSTKFGSLLQNKINLIPLGKRLTDRNAWSCGVAFNSQAGRRYFYRNPLLGNLIDRTEMHYAFFVGQLDGISRTQTQDADHVIVDIAIKRGISLTNCT